VPLYHGESGMTGWLNYVRAFVKHFSGRADHFEIWNEPFGLGHFWNYLGKIQYPELNNESRTRKCAQDYVEFVRRTAEVIREANPSARVIAYSDIFFFGRAAMEAGLANYVDIVAVHQYGGDECSFWTLRDRDCLRSLLKRHSEKIPEIWQGESGMSSGRSGHFQFASEYHQAKYIAKRVVTDLESGMSLSSIFTVIDFTNYYCDGTDQFFGIINGRTKQPKLGFFTLQSLGVICENLKLAPDISVWGMNPAFGGKHRQSVDFLAMDVVSMRKNGIPVIAYWLNNLTDVDATPYSGEMRIFFSSEDLKNFRHPVVVDPIRKNVFRVNNAVYGDAGDVTLSPLAVVDYPLFITNESIFDEFEDWKSAK
jgi:hypothetical protein